MAPDLVQLMKISPNFTVPAAESWEVNLALCSQKQLPLILLDASTTVKGETYS